MHSLLSVPVKRRSPRGKGEELPGKDPLQTQPSQGQIRWAGGALRQG